MGYTKKQWLSLVVAALICLTACGGGKTPDQPPTPAPPSNSQPDESPIIDAVKYGIDNTGSKDMTQKMIAMHKEGAEKGKPIYYPDGIYLFNGATLDFTSGVQFESADGVLIRNSISATPIVNFDDKGNLIGLMQNHLELKYNQQHYVDNGRLVSPPISTATYETKVDFPNCGFKFNRWLGLIWMEKRTKIVHSPSDFPKPWPAIVQDVKTFQNILDSLSLF